jgi:hypothetical protein
MHEIENFLPSVDIGGLVDRVGTSVISMLGSSVYQTSGHFMFRTSDNQRWVFLLKNQAGGGSGFEVRNLTNGATAEITVGPYVQSYVGYSTNLRYLPIKDTVLILNPAVTARWNPVGQSGAGTRMYVTINKLSSSRQTFYLNSAVGSANVVYDGSGGAKTRDWVAQQLQNSVGANMPGLGCSRINNVLKIQGPADIIGSILGGNDWDQTAMTIIKGRVTATSDLPASFFHGEALMVDLGSGDAKAAYWVTYDQTTNTYKETSWGDNFVPTGSLAQNTMPIRLHQTGPNSFELQPVDWEQRKVGDDNSNPPPPFIDSTITDMALWKGRLWLASGDTVYSSQPDDYFNFWSSSARQSLDSDPVSCSTDAELGAITHLASFHDSLMVFTANAQCTLDGSQPVKPSTASLGTPTRYDVDPLCVPVVIGDAMYYTGTSEGRSVLWEYQYQYQTQNNYAEDLSKHVPRYCPGDIRRIDGSAQSGRVFMWSAADPVRLYVQTSYWQEQQRKQNAWCKVSFSNVTSIWHHWVDEGTLYVMGTVGGYVALLSAPVDSNLGENPDTDVRIDMRQTVQVTWNATLNRSEIAMPAGMYQVTGAVVLEPNAGGWYTEHDITVVWNGQQWIGYFPQQVDVTKHYLLGVRFNRSFTFSPFYPAVGDSQTPMGRLQVHKVHMDCLKSGDFTGTVTRPDRIPMTVQQSPRTVGAPLVPNNGENLQYAIPFNAQGHKAQLTITTNSSAPMVVTGYTLAARYSNLFQS